MAPTASWIASRPEISIAEAATALERWWGLTGHLEELPSERDRNMLVRAGDGLPAHVFKIANLEENPWFLECQDRAMARLALAGVPVQQVTAAIDGREVVPLGEPAPWARVLTWLPGRTLSSVTAPEPELWSDLGATMGRSAAALLDFDHPAAHRVFLWDVVRAESVIADGLDAVHRPSNKALLGRVLDRLRVDLVPLLPRLRRSTIHNDANDHNVLVSDDHSRVVGLLDFGDMVHSVTAQEAAVASAYAMFGRDDPLAVMHAVIGGFVSRCQLTADELDALPSLVVARLAMSVAISATQARLSQNPYLRVSEAPAWDLLGRLAASPASELRAVVRDAVPR